MKRIPLITLCCMLLLITVFGRPFHPVYAAESYAVKSLETFEKVMLETIDGVIHAEGSVTGTGDTSIWDMGGYIVGVSDKPNHPFSYNRSAIAGLSTGITLVYGNPPASTYAFAVDMGKTLGFLPRTYAQGFGFTGLSPLLEIWKQFRNVAYGIIAIILIVVGFMVMLRKKIDPKTVVTVQNSIPRIVIALLLVTFSYAIVGFLIDLMYVSMLLIANLLGPIAKIADTPSAFISGNFINAAGSFIMGGWKSFVGIFNAIPWYVHSGTMAAAGIVGLALFGLSMGGLKALATAGTPHALFFLLIALTLLFGMVRLFFLLLDAYIHIIISLLTSPFHLMMEAIPGVGSFSSWMRNLISKLIVFPLVTALLLITQVITSGDTASTMWIAPYLFNGANVDGLMGIIGLGMLLSIPSIVAGVQKMLKAEPVIPGGVGAITGPLGGSLGQLFNLVYQGSFIRSAFRKDHGPSPYQQAISGGSAGLGGIVKGPGGQGH